MSERHDPALERSRRAAAELAELDVDEARPRDFNDVLARAKRLGGTPLDEAAVVAATRLDEAHARATGAGETDSLAVFIAAARAVAERDVSEQTAEGVPRMRRAVHAWVVPMVVVLALAAAIILVVGLTALPSSLLDDEREHSQAADVAAPAPAFEAIAVEPPAPARRVPHAPQQVPEPVPEPVTPPPALVDEPAQAPLEPPSQRATLEQRLRGLADEAEDALASGDAERADDVLRRLISIGGQHRLVELAYGDRFTIAHRAGIVDTQVELWRAYLRKFPSGRFAEDARAGLCRHAARGRALGCWRDYLSDFPEGAYRNLAERTITEHGVP